jgi:hypothetical protein
MPRQDYEDALSALNNLAGRRVLVLMVTGEEPFTTTEGVLEPGVLPGPQRTRWSGLDMPIAEPLRQALGITPTIDTVVDAVAAVADTLGRLAERGVAHRDIKP